MAVTVQLSTVLAPGAESGLRFNRDIRPLFADTCLACHGPDSNARKAGLRLDTRRMIDKLHALGLRVDFWTVDDPLEAATRDVPPTEAVLGPQSESEPAGPGTLLWSEAADSGWQATVDGATATRGDAFGWTNAFAVEERGSVDLTFDEGLRRVIAYLEMVAWFVVAALWWRSRSREQAVDLDPDESSEAETYEPPVEVAS